MDKIEDYWQEYLDMLPENSPVRDEEYKAEGFGDNPEMADRLGTLVADGTKTATCSALWEYEGEPFVSVRQKTVAPGGSGDPLCIIETMEVEVRPYDRVDARFAAEEGEGDLSLDYWRAAHWTFFSRPAEDRPEAESRHAARVREIPRNPRVKPGLPSL